MSDPLADRIASLVGEISDFPKPGVVYRDVTPIMEDATAFHDVVQALAERCEGPAELVCGVEARGFVFGAALAHRLSLGFIPIRGPGRLPRDHASVGFALEYGFDVLEVHRDSLAGGRRVVLVDDLLGTGRTMGACVDLVRQAGGVVALAAVVVEVEALGGRAKLAEAVEPVEVISLCRL